MRALVVLGLVGGTIALAVGAAPASAGLGLACPTPTSTPFLPWNDYAYYAFSPIHIPCPAINGIGSSTVTPAGAALGFSDANFGSAHNTYGNPGPSSPLKVAAAQTASPNAPTALFAKVHFPHH